MTRVAQIVDILLEGGADSHIDLPKVSEVLRILREHPLIRLRERVKRAFLIGSFADNRGKGHSDVDILLEVVPRPDMTEEQLTTHYRRPLMRYFMQNDIRDKADHVHPQWAGRRIDLYLTYDADREQRPKIQLPP